MATVTMPERSSSVGDDEDVCHTADPESMRTLCGVPIPAEPFCDPGIRVDGVCRSCRRPSCPDCDAEGDRAW